MAAIKRPLNFFSIKSTIIKFTIRKKTRIRNRMINPLYLRADIWKNPNPAQKLGGMPSTLIFILIVDRGYIYKHFIAPLGQQTKVFYLCLCGQF